MQNNKNEWPKKWSEIEGRERPNYDDDYWQVGSELHAGIVRTYEGTLYINAGSGYETDKNSNLWLPLGIYLNKNNNL